MYDRREIFSEYNKYIKPDEGIATEVYALAHYANRRYIYNYPGIKKGVKWIIYDSNKFRYIKSDFKEKSDRKRMLDFLLKNKYFKVMKNIKGIMLLERIR